MPTNRNKSDQKLCWQKKVMFTNLILFHKLQIKYFSISHKLNSISNIYFTNLNESNFLKYFTKRKFRLNLNDNIIANKDEMHSIIWNSVSAAHRGAISSSIFYCCVHTSVARIWSLERQIQFSRERRVGKF